MYLFLEVVIPGAVEEPVYQYRYGYQRRYHYRYVGGAFGKVDFERRSDERYYHGYTRYHYERYKRVSDRSPEIKPRFYSLGWVYRPDDKRKGGK